jgi:hypothetical protein
MSPATGHEVGVAGMVGRATLVRRQKKERSGSVTLNGCVGSNTV